MFTGIVQGTAEILKVVSHPAFRTHTLRFPAQSLTGVQCGASIAHNGCCLTVTAIHDDTASFDLMQETLSITNLGELQPGDLVNFERAARFGDEIGGHQMSGHILCTAQVTQVVASEHNRQLEFELPPQFSRYLFTKGYIGVDGISLTIGQLSGNRFNVNLIPETLARTNIGSRQAGDRVNIEIDPQTQAIVDTVERVMQEQLERYGGIPGDSR
ncbi:MAG: riboflavin synthase subunit alpha [Gammaproteobacteria bacterium]|nr:riboflavin synthase subunit alpha [Gammaproteobacteria bacterium]